MIFIKLWLYFCFHVFLIYASMLDIYIDKYTIYLYDLLIQIYNSIPYNMQKQIQLKYLVSTVIKLNVNNILNLPSSLNILPFLSLY